MNNEKQPTDRQIADRYMELMHEDDGHLSEEKRLLVRKEMGAIIIEQINRFSQTLEWLE